MPTLEALTEAYLLALSRVVAARGAARQLHDYAHAAVSRAVVYTAAPVATDEALTACDLADAAMTALVAGEEALVTAVVALGVAAQELAMASPDPVAVLRACEKQISDVTGVRLPATSGKN